MDEVAGLEKDGVERDLQEALAAAPGWLEDELRLVRREWSTEIGPVDLMCRDCDDGWVAVEIKRHRDDRGGRAADALPRLHPRRPGQGALPRDPRRAALQAAGGHAGRIARDRLRRGRSRGAARRARARADAVRLVRCGHFRGGEAYTTLMVVKVGVRELRENLSVLPRPRQGGRRRDRHGTRTPIAHVIATRDGSSNFACELIRQGTITPASGRSSRIDDLEAAGKLRARPAPRRHRDRDAARRRADASALVRRRSSSEPSRSRFA